ncbi:hypothetical protein E4T50_17193 [Aureobasidium sp. EXF-12298]|nr:hypothetical protein E4T50_17193 [Aureobasidium sp. EXF-12298]KAI4749874.1 hypothetical protein E4T51_16719 [Aureobasidium sp. EXF-12344]KAI4767260.1 hypothetical protein E4T52_17502 [Aureobasidium sp. EXF-3400]
MFGAMEKERTSGAVERPKQAEPVLPVSRLRNEKAHEAAIEADSVRSVWIAMSSSVIIFNKYILDEKKLNFHESALQTTILARFTTVLDLRKKVPMNGRVYLRAIVPIGLFFSLSLICGNLTYLYLSVSFI